MKVAVFGLGYVGCVTAAGFAHRGQEVLGVDTELSKVDAITRGKASVVEPGLSERVASAVACGRLRATVDATAAAASSELSLICVGTPSERNGSLSTEALERVVTTVGSALRDRPERHTVVVRSTMLPGTAEGLLIPLLERAAGRRVGPLLGFAVNPEFLREGTSLDDFDEPVKTVIGEADLESGDSVEELYNGFGGIIVRLPLAGAEMAKYIDNAFHALKITFANEVGAVCRSYDLDSHQVFRSFLVDTKLNISPAYLTPGFAFGGSCLPKDLRALLYAARQRDLNLPMLEGVLVSNEQCLTRVVDTVVQLGHRKIGLFGLSFKGGTDDLRESPFVELSERLIGKGFRLRIYDPRVSLSRLVGSNRSYIEQRIPHLGALLVDSPGDVLRECDVCIVGAAEEETVRALAEKNGHVIVDLVRLPDAKDRRGGRGYIGVAW